MYLWNVGLFLWELTAPYLRRLRSSCFPPWEHEVPQNVLHFYGHRRFITLFTRVRHWTSCLVKFKMQTAFIFVFVQPTWKFCSSQSNLLDHVWHKQNTKMAVLYALILVFCKAVDMETLGMPCIRHIHRLCRFPDYRCLRCFPSLCFCLQATVCSCSLTRTNSILLWMPPVGCHLIQYARLNMCEVALGLHY